MKKKNNTLVLFKQTLKDVEKIIETFLELIWKDDFKDICRQTWEDENYKHPFIDWSEQKSEVKIVFEVKRD